MSTRDYSLPLLAFEDAYNRLATWLQRELRQDPGRTPTGDRLQFDISVIIDELLQEIQQEDYRARPARGMTLNQRDPRPNSGPFHDACWELCRRGVLRPAIRYRHSQEPELTGFQFAVTSYGAEWLAAQAALEATPADYSRFGGLLEAHVSRLGEGYRVRAREALASYRAQTYLACCAMCGAAAESILLALAIAKTGDEVQVLRDYQTVTGRSKVERLLKAQQNSYVQTEITNFTDLLKYWRDAASHGASVNIDEEKAYTSLLILLRFARFADERWADLTASGPAQTD